MAFGVGCTRRHAFDTAVLRASDTTTTISVQRVYFPGTIVSGSVTFDTLPIYAVVSHLREATETIEEWVHADVRAMFERQEFVKRLETVLQENCHPQHGFSKIRRMSFCVETWVAIGIDPLKNA